MSHPILRLNDGFDHTSPELRDEVKTLQTELNQEGFALEVDGLFGRDTESAVKRFQREHGLDDDGIVGPLTWAALLGTNMSGARVPGVRRPAARRLKSRRCMAQGRRA